MTVFVYVHFFFYLSCNMFVRTRFQTGFLTFRLKIKKLKKRIDFRCRLSFNLNILI
jgi:hypothetical protein